MSDSGLKLAFLCTEIDVLDLSEVKFNRPEE